MSLAATIFLSKGGDAREAVLAFRLALSGKHTGGPFDSVECTEAGCSVQKIFIEVRQKCSSIVFSEKNQIPRGVSDLHIPEIQNTGNFLEGWFPQNMVGTEITVQQTNVAGSGGFAKNSWSILWTYARSAAVSRGIRCCSALRRTS